MPHIPSSFEHPGTHSKPHTTRESNAPSRGFVPSIVPGKESFQGSTGSVTFRSRPFASHLQPIRLDREPNASCWIKPSEAGGPHQLYTRDPATDAPLPTGKYVRADAQGQWVMADPPASVDKPMPPPARIDESQLLPLVGGLFPGRDGNNYVRIDGQYYAARYDTQHKIWKAVDARNPFAFYGAVPMRLDGKGGAEVLRIVGLRGGMDDAQPGPSRGQGRSRSPEAMIMDVFGGMDRQGARAFLDRYRFPQNAVFNEVNLALALAQTGEVPAWADRFLAEPPSATQTVMRNYAEELRGALGDHAFERLRAIVDEGAHPHGLFRSLRDYFAEQATAHALRQPDGHEVLPLPDVPRIQIAQRLADRLPDLLANFSDTEAAKKWYAYFLRSGEEGDAHLNDIFNRGLHHYMDGDAVRIVMEYGASPASMNRYLEEARHIQNLRDMREQLGNEVFLRVFADEVENTLAAYEHLREINDPQIRVDTYLSVTHSHALRDLVLDGVGGDIALRERARILFDSPVIAGYLSEMAGGVHGILSLISDTDIPNEVLVRFADYSRDRTADFFIGGRLQGIDRLFPYLSRYL